jgi:hypothetical protein
MQSHLNPFIGDTNINLYSRTGETYSLLTTFSYGPDYTSGSGQTCRWSSDGSKILTGGGDTSGRIFNFSGSTLTVTVTGSSIQNFVLSKSAADQFYNLLDAKLYSWNSSNVLSEVGTTTGSVVTGNCATGMLSD